MAASIAAWGECPISNAARMQLLGVSYSRLSSMLRTGVIAPRKFPQPDDDRLRDDQNLGHHHQLARTERSRAACPGKFITLFDSRIGDGGKCRYAGTLPADYLINMADSVRVARMVVTRDQASMRSHGSVWRHAHRRDVIHYRCPSPQDGHGSTPTLFRMHYLNYVCWFLSATA
jgi:hypothetical protein